MTVVASRVETSVNDLTSSVNIIDSERLQRELARDIKDVIRFEPGVVVGGTGSRFGLDGFNIRGIGGNRVLTMIDGIRVPDELSFGPFLSARRDFVDIGSVNRVKLQGALFLQHGAATQWVVSLHSRHPLLRGFSAMIVSKVRSKLVTQAPMSQS